MKEFCYECDEKVKTYLHIREGNGNRITEIRCCICDFVISDEGIPDPDVDVSYKTPYMKEKGKKKKGGQLSLF